MYICIYVGWNRSRVITIELVTTDAVDRCSISKSFWPSPCVATRGGRLPRAAGSSITAVDTRVRQTKIPQGLTVHLYTRACSNYHTQAWKTKTKYIIILIASFFTIESQVVRYMSNAIYKIWDGTKIKKIFK